MSQGAQGPRGSQGAQGVQGAEGSQGMQGPQGITGATGGFDSWLVRALTIYVPLAITFLLALTAYQINHDNSRLTLKVCHGQNQVRETIAGLIATNDKQLGQKGTAGYAYYRQHPDELAAGHKANAAALKTFGPLKC